MTMHKDTNTQKEKNLNGVLVVAAMFTRCRCAPGDIQEPWQPLATM